MEAGRLTSLDENLHGSCFDVCVARGGCGRMKPASSNFSAPRTHKFSSHIWRDGRGNHGINSRFSAGNFSKGRAQTQTPKSRTQAGAVRIKSQMRVRQHRASGATERVLQSCCCLVICDTRARHHGGHGRRPERRRDLHVRGAMARVRDELECECPSMTLLRPAAFLPARANPSPAPHSDLARSAADATLRTRPAVDRRAPRRDLTR